MKKFFAYFISGIFWLISVLIVLPMLHWAGPKFGIPFIAEINMLQLVAIWVLFDMFASVRLIGQYQKRSEVEETDALVDAISTGLAQVLVVLLSWGVLFLFSLNL